MKKTRSLHAITLIVAAFLVSSCTWDDSLIDYAGGMHCDDAKDLANYPLQTGITFVTPERDMCKQEHECVLDGSINKCAPCEALGLVACGEDRVCVDLVKANLSDCNTCSGNYMNIDKSTREELYTCETDISSNNKYCGQKDIVKDDPSLLKNCTLEANTFCLDGACKTCSDGLVLLDVETAPGSEKICVNPKIDVRYCGASAGDEGVPCNDDQYCDKGLCTVCNVVDGRIGLCNASSTQRVCMELSDDKSCGICNKTCDIGQECWESEGKFVCVAKSDINNCGEIGKSCMADAQNANNARCVADVCQYDCKLGYADAKKDSKDARLLDGCEMPVQNADNCGGIGIKCDVAPNTINDCFVNLDGGEDAYVGCKCAIGFFDKDRDPQNGCEAECNYPRVSCINPNVCDRLLGSDTDCGACDDVCQFTDTTNPYINDMACFTKLKTYESHQCQASECTEGYYTENYTSNLEASKLCQTPCPSTHLNCENSLNECATDLIDMRLVTCSECLSGYKNCDDNSENGCETSLLDNKLTDCKVCSSGYGNCDGDWKNGCEARFSTMNLDGSCEKCSSGYGNCDGDWKNGCEARFSTMNLDGACEKCSSGYGNCDGDWKTGCETNFLDNKLTSCGVCISDYSNCDGNWDTGCETDLRLVATCGSCAKPADCPLNFSCIGDECHKK